MTEHITGALFRAMILNASAAIERHKTEVNELNVFPVPDGDTGTNMSLTIGAGARALTAEEPRTVGKAADLTANALLRGARGNSGVILSLLFRGVSKRLHDAETADARLFAAALCDGVDTAYKAVMKPTEGTILTVSRLASAAARECAEGERDIEAVLTRALEVGRVALADTINQNPVLKKAGVIDSGGKGYLYILDGMLRALRGEVIEGGAGDTEGRERANFTDFDTGDITFAYCTEFIVSRENPRDPNALRAFLDARGDSIVLVDDDEIIKVHVHTNEPGDVITEALTYGALLSVKIENMREQHTAQLAAERPGEPDKRYGMAAVCSGPGLADVFRDLGADQIITGGQTMNPSTDDILAKVEAVRAEIVFVFPNNKNIIMAAEQCVPLSTKKVVVIPSKSVPQGVSAMLAFDETLTEDENSANMRAPLTKVRTLQVTRAARDSVFDGHSIREGEHLALLEDSLLTSGTDFAAVAAIVAEKLKEIAPDFITVFTGEDARADDTATLSALFARHIPNAEATVVEGGQPVYEYIISAE